MKSYITGAYKFSLHPQPCTPYPHSFSLSYFCHSEYSVSYYPRKNLVVQSSQCPMPNVTFLSLLSSLVPYLFLSSYIAYLPPSLLKSSIGTLFMGCGCGCALGKRSRCTIFSSKMSVVPKLQSQSKVYA